MHKYKDNKKGVPAGTFEAHGKIMAERLYVIGIIESIYRKYGFDPLGTPTIEYSSVFKGHHGEGESLLFNLKDKGENDLVLRYDLTVPFARYVSDHYLELPIPFKRYQIASVFRDDEIDKGHFREFVQCDGDIVGTSDLVSDAEVISMAHAGLTRLGFTCFVINVNHRRILNAISEKSGLFEINDRLNLQRALDGVSKFAEKCDRCIEKEVFDAGINAILRNYKLSDKAIEVVSHLFLLEGNFEQKICKLEEYLKEFPEAVHGINELREIVSYLNSDVQETVNLDLSLARGADYYTGFILEGSIPNIPVGAVLGGGRFDNLVGNLGGPDLPAVGMSFGLERIITCMAELNINHNIQFARVIVVPMSKEDKKELLGVANKLRLKGMEVDYVPMILHDDKDVRAYAKKRNFSYLITSNNARIQVEKIGEGDVPDLLLCNI